MIMKNKKQEKSYSSIVVSFLIGMIFAFAIVQIYSEPASEIDMDGHKHEHAEHAKYEYVGENPPSVELNVVSDTKSGYNVELITENFIFSPENVNSENIDGEGHAHIYINGEKQRLYSSWYHLDHLHSDSTEIKVTLNTNMHEEYVVDGEVVSDTYIIIE